MSYDFRHFGKQNDKNPKTIILQGENIFKIPCCLIKHTQTLLSRHTFLQSTQRQVHISLFLWWMISTNKIKQAHKLSFLISFDKLCENLDIVFLFIHSARNRNRNFTRWWKTLSRWREPESEARFGKLNFGERRKANLVPVEWLRGPARFPGKSEKFPIFFYHRRLILFLYAMTLCILFLEAWNEESRRFSAKLSRQFHISDFIWRNPRVWFASSHFVEYS